MVQAERPLEVKVLVQSNGARVRRVLMTADTRGAVWTYALELAGALGAYGVDVILASMGGPLRPAQRRAVTSLGSVRLCEGRFKAERMDESWDDVSAAGDWLLDLADRTHADLVHLNGYAHGNLAWPVPCLIVAHSCVCSWWRAVKNEEASPPWGYRVAVAAGLHGADGVVAPSRALLAALHRHYGLSRRGVVIPHGRDTRLFAPRAKQQYVFAAGRLWDDAKNVRALGAVAPGLPWPVVIAGAVPHPCDAAQLGANIELLGQLTPEGLAAWLGAAAIYALPACDEPCGLSVLEAALAGCALVLGDVPGLRELWDGAALFVRPGDHAELHATLSALIADSVTQRRLAAQARARALRCTPRRMAAEYLTVYRTLLSHHPLLSHHSTGGAVRAGMADDVHASGERLYAS